MLVSMLGLLLLLSPAVVAAVAVTAIWSAWATWTVLVARYVHRKAVNVRTELLPRLVLYVVLMLFFLYPQVCKELVSTLSCHPVDSKDSFMQVAPKKCDKSDLDKAMKAMRYQETYWGGDTLVTCWHGQHTWMVILGTLGLAFFAIGLPVSIYVLLKRAKKQLQQKQVELQLGFLYASYRMPCYPWESVVLLQKLAMVLSVTLLQGVSVGLQVLMAIAVVFVSALLQVSTAH